jgi:ParB-like chromosome segregation protein Spo0J
LAIVRQRIDALRPDPANPRLHNKKQIRQIANSIEVFGFNVPILVDCDGKVIAGHGRLLACGELGWTEVPTLCLDHLTTAQARAFMIADNRLAEVATWDDQLLAEQLRELSLLGLDFKIEVTGFEMGEIDLRIASLEDLPETTADPATFARSDDRSADQQARGLMASRSPPRAVRQRPRPRGLQSADGRRTRRDGVHRSAL